MNTTSLCLNFNVLILLFDKELLRVACIGYPLAVTAGVKTYVLTLVPAETGSARSLVQRIPLAKFTLFLPGRTESLRTCVVGFKVANS